MMPPDFLNGFKVFAAPDPMMRAGKAVNFSN